MERKLENMKKEYEKLREKYKLPEYKILNEEFDVEKVAENETETLLREIRKLIMEKVIAYLRFIELLLNPTNAPMFFFALLKGLEASDKKILDNLYTKLGRIEIEVIDIDNDYSEKNEAEFIKKIFKEWQEVKEEMRTVSKALQQGWDKKSEKKEKSYVG